MKKSVEYIAHRAPIEDMLGARVNKSVLMRAVLLLRKKKPRELDRRRTTFWNQCYREMKTILGV